MYSGGRRSRRGREGKEKLKIADKSGEREKQGEKEKSDK